MKIQHVQSANFVHSLKVSSKTQKESNYNTNFKSNLTSIPYNPAYNVNFSASNKPSRKLILDTIKTAEPLSDAGFKGIVYKYKFNKKDYVVKVARKPEFSFENEAMVLGKIPSTLKNSQQLVDYFKTPDGKDVLVTSFVQGKKGVLLSNEQYYQFFDTLFALDKLGILHGDLNTENTLIAGNSVNLIDYGEGQIFEPEECYDELYPSFVVKNNSVNFEHNGASECIEGWEKQVLDCKSQFRKLLAYKAQYYQRRLSLFKNKTSNSYDYEQNLSKVLMRPSERVVECEIRRIDVLHAMEGADSSTNYHRIPKDAKRNWNTTLQKAKEACEFIEETLESDSLSQQERKYFEYQSLILNNIYDSFKDWSEGTIGWLDRICATEDVSTLSAVEKELYNNRNKTTDYSPYFGYSAVMN